MKKTKVKMKGAHFGILYRWTTHAHTGDFIFVQEETLVNAKVTLILLYFFWLLQHSRTFLSTRSPTLAAPTSAAWQRAALPQLSASVWAEPLRFPEEIRLQPPLRTGLPFASPCWPGGGHSAPILPPGSQAGISSRPSPIPTPSASLTDHCCQLAPAFLQTGEGLLSCSWCCEESPGWQFGTSAPCSEFQRVVTLALGPSIPSSLTI